MKGIIMDKTGKFLLYIIITLASLVSAQDIQTLYEEAKNALLSGDYQASLIKLAEAKRQIALDPNLDPNQAFSNKLIPDLETNSQKIAKIAQVLEELYQTSVTNLDFTDLPPSLESARMYDQQAQQFSAELLAKKQALLSSTDLEPQYLEALQKLPTLSNLEQLAARGVMAELSEKYNQITSVFIDSLHAVDIRYKDAQEKIALLLSTTDANKQEMQKLQRELTRLSSERLQYMNAISQMLQGEAGSEIEPLRKSLTAEQVQDTFSSVILAEIERIKGITTIDSAGYKNLLSSYDRIKNYNLIFYQNNISSDQSALLAQYEAAFKAIRVAEPVKINRLLLIGVVVVGLIVFITTAIIVQRKKRTIERE